jgi:hypothetical protein
MIKVDEKGKPIEEKNAEWWIAEGYEKFKGFEPFENRL